MNETGNEIGNCNHLPFFQGNALYEPSLKLIK